MLCLCLYVPVFGESQTEFEYFESKGLPAELKSIFRLSLFIPSQEFSTYRQWKQVWPRGRNGWEQAKEGWSPAPQWLVRGGEVDDGSVVIAGYSMDTVLLPRGRDCQRSMEWAFFFLILLA